MKKLILLVSLFGLFILASCDDEPIIDLTPSTSHTDSNQQNDEDDLKNNGENDSNIITSIDQVTDGTITDNQNDNSELEEKEPSKNEDSISSNTSETSLPEYDDGTEWEGDLF